MSKKSNNKSSGGTIAQNRKARHDYHLEDRYEAGIELQGWEIKSIRLGKANISDAYVIIKNGEAYLFGAQIQPLNSASSHVVCDPERSRKLLLHRRELLGGETSGLQQDGVRHAHLADVVQVAAPT